MAELIKPVAAQNAQEWCKANYVSRSGNAPDIYRTEAICTVALIRRGANYRAYLIVSQEDMYVMTQRHEEKKWYRIPIRALRSGGIHPAIVKPLRWVRGG